MEELPNEIIHMILNCMTYHQKLNASRISKIFAYLTLTFRSPVLTICHCNVDIKQCKHCDDFVNEWENIWKIIKDTYPRLYFHITHRKLEIFSSSHKIVHPVITFMDDKRDAIIIFNAEIDDKAVQPAEKYKYDADGFISWLKDIFYNENQL